jgi:hypothetical protein
MQAVHHNRRFRISVVCRDPLWTEPYYYVSGAPAAADFSCHRLFVVLGWAGKRSLGCVSFVAQTRVVRGPAAFP